VAHFIVLVDRYDPVAFLTEFESYGTANNSGPNDDNIRLFDEYLRLNFLKPVCERNGAQNLAGSQLA
jgi:hypothetical protein